VNLDIPLKLPNLSNDLFNRYSLLPLVLQHPPDYFFHSIRVLYSCGQKSQFLNLFPDPFFLKSILFLIPIHHDTDDLALELEVLHQSQREQGGP
jgi:hypothetical protein